MIKTNAGTKAVVLTMERKPIKLTDDNKIDRDDNIEELVENVVTSNFVGADNNMLSVVEKAFIGQFPSLYNLKYKPIRKKPMTFMSKYSPFKHRPWQIKIKMIKRIKN